MPETMSLLEKMRSNAMRGKWSDVLETYKKERSLRMANITATEDTVLHMAVSSEKEKVVASMVDILVKEEKSRAPNNVVVTVDGVGEESWNVNAILGAENDRKNTPLHLASITGNVEICKKIGDADRSLITRRNIVGETPLFLAALYGRRKAFLWLHYLYKRSQGDSSTGLPHWIRDNDDTILHCAIAEEHFGVAIEIFHLYKDLVRGMRRNEEGLSPLHLLAAKRSAFKSTGLHSVPILVHPIYWLWKVEEKKQATTFEELQNENKENILVKRTRLICSLLLLLPVFLLTCLLTFLLLILLLALSEAVLRRWFHQIPKIKKKHIWSHQIMTELLQHASHEDMSQIILRTAGEHLSILRVKVDKESESGTITIETPLMIAAKNGVMEMVEKILELYPLRIKDVNADGRNILLQAVEYRQTKVFGFLSKQKGLCESVFREVDKEGNNALHLAARPGEINWFVFVEDSMPCGLSMRYNRQMETPDDIFRKSFEELKKREREWVAKTSEACSVVSTLVVSVAYGTRTNLPGGYDDDDNGYAVLRNKPSEFKVFKDYSFVALFLSLMSTVCFLSIVASPSQSAHSWRYVPSRFYCGVYFMFASIVCLWISFCAADFFMLHDQTHKLQKALPTYILLSSGFILMAVFQLPIFLGPKLSTFFRIPSHSSHMASPPIEYRRTKHK